MQKSLSLVHRKIHKERSLSISFHRLLFNLQNPWKWCPWYSSAKRVRFEVIKKPKCSRQVVPTLLCLVRKIPFRAQNGGVCYLYHGASEAELWDKKKTSRARVWEGKWSSSVGAASPSSCSSWFLSLQPLGTTDVPPAWDAFPTGNGNKLENPQQIRIFSPWKRV